MSVEDTPNVTGNPVVDGAVQCGQVGVYVFPCRWTYNFDTKKKEHETFHQWWGGDKRKPSPANLGGVAIRAAFAGRDWNAYGMDMGASGLVGIDLDGHDAAARFFALCTEHGCDPIADGAFVKHTPREGGQHLLFRADPERPVGVGAGMIGPGIDHRGIGGLLYGSGSFDERGPYSGPPMARPSSLPMIYPWLADLISGGKHRPSEPVMDENDEDDPFFTPGNCDRVFSRAEADSAIATALGVIRAAPIATLNDALIRQGPWLFKFCPAFMGDREMAKAILQAQREAWIAGGGPDDGDYRSAKKTINSARNYARKSWAAVLADEDDDTPDPLAAIVTDGEDGGDHDAVEDEKTSDKRKGIFFTDARFSELVADLFSKVGICHCPEMGWMSWTGIIWERTEEDTAIDVNRRWCLKRWKIAKVKLDAAEADSPAEEVSRLSNLAEAWRTMCSRAKLTATVALARPQVKVAFEAFDADPDLLNTASGVVDLRTGKMVPHDKSRYMTKVTRASYQGAEFTHPTWEKAISAVPEDSQAWVQMFMGQGITGRLNTEGRLLLLDGDGSNGKGVLCNEGAVWTLGDYAVILNESIITDSGNQHPTEKMALRGARLTLIDETPEARRLDTQRMKKLLDQPKMAGARYLYKEGKEFVLTHTLIVMTNYKPAVTEYDRGTWRRLIRLKMPYTYKGASEPQDGTDDRPGDPGLKTALREDSDVQAACLAWLVRGAMSWYAAERCQPLGDEPKRVADDTKDWRGNGDLIMNYAGEFLVFEENSHVLTVEAHKHFSEWCENQGNKPWSLTTFLSRIEGHEVTKGRVEILKRQYASSFTTPASRPDGSYNGVTKQYSAVRGVRFKTKEELGETDAPEGSDPWDD